MKFQIQSIYGNLLFAAIVLIFISLGCKKQDDFDLKSNISLSKDTISFDTVFTTIGSSTEYFMIYNRSDKPLNISKAWIAKGSSSNFRINIDGISSHSITDIEIGANDSLFAFVEVTVDPNGANVPLLITDSILFEVNGQISDIDLIAYGQDAYFIIANKHIEGLPPYKIVAGEGVDTTWDNTKPIVVYGYAVVDSAATLRISKGTKIYFHNNSGLWTYVGGTLIVEGTKDEPVVFQGDRLEDAYKDVPGQWDRIWLNESPNQHKISYAIIKNGFIGLQTEPLSSYNSWNAQLQIDNTQITNMSGAGILSRSSIINGYNLLITNCQQYCAALTVGGIYEFYHSTFANFWGYSVRQSPAVYLNNYFKDGKNNVYPADLIKSDFVNCIIYGNLENEFVPDSVNNADFNFLIDHCNVKTNIAAQSGRFISLQKNMNPLFYDYQDDNYHLSTLSPALNAGKPTSYLIDLDGEPRSASAPAIGAYEKPQ